MKIINDERPTKVSFGTLNSGDVFEWCGGFYIKTEGEDAVLLESGNWDNFPKDCLVRPVEATLVIS